MKTLCALLILASAYSFGQEFSFIDQFIQQNRESMMFEVTSGSSQRIHISCPVEVYEELYQDQNGYAAIMHLYQKTIEQNPSTNNGAIEKLLMLAILGEPTEEQRSLNKEKTKYLWAISRIRSEAVYAGFPKQIEDWKTWGSKLDARNKSIRAHMSEQD
ncbi:hypothetical protein [Coraliomargarita akajimensis]|uniref:Uncharacterized protein n=1 Tax=Coraliomargarita akajimensis (strain DSM 45221 / IAM 15411 / JCM 23193 / KCTC 12865 / 04OKA010-24) TaxID=583355 RepID=D5EMD1_CORAD|nr:hypothetical protein [Coraliomargarita akajimensis]ADE53337.1 hypothetical protein Caka_0312 [Coraliomargarita akajimensis DSM 45221]